MKGGRSFCWLRAEAMGLSLSQPESVEGSAAVTIQRVWRGCRERSFLRLRYYVADVSAHSHALTSWNSTASLMSNVAISTRPDACVREALREASRASRHAERATKLCAEYERSMLDICTQRSHSKDFSVRGFLHEVHHTSTLNINEELSGAQLTKFKPEPLKSPKDVTTLSSKGAEASYQMKVCKDSKATARAIMEKKYEGITKVVPKDQCKAINRSDVQDRISSATKSGVHSDPISKEDLDKMTNQARHNQRTEVVAQKREEIKQFRKRSEQNVVAKTKQGCKTAAKAALIAAGLAALTSLASSTYKLLPQWKRGDISLTAAVHEAWLDLLSSSGAAGATGLLMGLVEVLCEHFLPQLSTNSAWACQLSCG